MYNRSILTAICLFISLVSHAQYQWEWVHPVQGNINSANAVCIDNEGYLYSAGYFRDSIILGSVVLHNNAQPINNDGYICKYDQAGNVIWAKKFGGLDEDIVNGIAVDNNKNIFIFGQYVDSIELDTILLTGTANFIARLDSVGNVAWAREIPATVKTLAIGSDLTLYIGGFFPGSIILDGIPLYGSGNSELFIARYNLDGTIRWAHRAGNDGDESVISIKIDRQGNPVLEGTFSDSLALGPVNLYADDANCHNCRAFIAKMDSSGEYNWAKRFNAEQEEFAIVLDTLNNCFLASVFVDTAKFGALSIPPDQAGEHSMCLVKFDSSGAIIWGKAVGHASTFNFGPEVNLTIDINDDMYLATNSRGDITFGSHFFSSALSGTNLVVAKFNPSGDIDWTQNALSSATSSFSSLFTDLTTDDQGNVYTVGGVSEDCIFGEDTFTVSTPLNFNMNSFLAKLSSITAIRESGVVNMQFDTYPNPSSGNFNLRTDGSTTSAFAIFDVNGRVIYMGEIAKGLNSTAVSLPNASTGIYYLRLTNAHGSQTQKLIILK